MSDEKEYPKLTIGNFIKLVVNRQVKKDSDTLIIIYGLPRTGKTTLGFKLIIAYLNLMKRLYKEGKSQWNPPKYWKDIFRNYFSMDATDMSRKVMRNPERSFSFVDEGNDLLSWFNQMEKEQQELVKLLLKIGKRKVMTIIIIPSFQLLTKSVLSRARYLMLIQDEPTPDGNYVHVFKNYNNPILAENKPFGMKDIIAKVLKHPNLGQKDSFEMLISRNDRYVGKIHYKGINKKLYELYDKLVKEPSIIRAEQKQKTVPYGKFAKLQYAFDTLLYRLKYSDNKTYTQIISLLTDKFGNRLVSMELMRNHLDKMLALEKPPAINYVEEESEDVKPEEEIPDMSLEDVDDEGDSKTVSVGGGPNHLHGEGDAEDEADQEEDK